MDGGVPLLLSGLNEIGPVSFNAARSAFRLVVCGPVSLRRASSIRHRVGGCRWLGVPSRATWPVLTQLDSVRRAHARLSETTKINPTSPAGLVLVTGPYRQAAEPACRTRFDETQPANGPGEPTLSENQAPDRLTVLALSLRTGLIIC
jgi:hypothetical protein